MNDLQMPYRYFILRTGAQALHIKDPQLSEDQKIITCHLEPVADNHWLHFKNQNTQRRKYSVARGERTVLTEIHFYINSDTLALPGEYTLYLEKVTQIEFIEYDGAKTFLSHAVGFIGATVGIMIVAAAIIVATKSSCPFVSAYDGQTFSLQGEIYGGAIYPQLARHDYLPLRMARLPDGSLRLKISNELKERQYTDLAELIVVTHDTSMSVLPDESGKLYSLSDPQLPIAAYIDHKTVLKSLAQRHDNAVLYMDDSTHADGVNEVFLTFNKSPGANQGKLVLSLKNSYFLDLLYGEITKAYGSYYPTQVENQRKRPAKELLQWMDDQCIPLKVSVRTTAGWVYVTSIPTIGPIAFRDIVIPLDLATHNDSILEIMLSAGFLFWEVDYAACDFSINESFTAEYLLPVSAIDELGKNVTALVTFEDGVFLEQPEIGNVVTLVYYGRSLKEGISQSYILHTKGYYEYIRDYQDPPDAEFLRQINAPGAFPKYGMAKYQAIGQTCDQLLAGNN